MQRFILFIITVIALSSCNLLKTNDNSTDFYKNGDIFFQSYKYYKAIGQYQKYIKTSGLNNDSLFFNSHIQIFLCYCKTDNKRAADNIAQKIDSLSKCNPYNKFHLTYTIFKIYKEMNNGNSRKSIDNIYSVLQYLPKNDTGKAEFYYQLANNYRNLEILDSCEYFFYKALNYARAKKDKQTFEFVNYYSKLGYITALYSQNKVKAKLYFDTLMNIAPNCKFIDSAAFAYDLIDIGWFYSTGQNNFKALEYFNMSYNLYKKIGIFKDDMVETLFRISFIESYYHKFDAALAKTEQAIFYSKQKKNVQNLIRALEAKAHIFSRQKKYDSELQILYDILNQYRINNISPTVYDYDFLANCYGKMGNKDSANYYFNKCFIEYNKGKIKRIEDLVTLKGEYARFLNLIHNYKEALEVIREDENNVKAKINNNSEDFGYYIYWKAFSLQNLKQYSKSLEVYQEVILSSIKNNYSGNLFDPPSFKVTDVISYDNIIDALIGKAEVLECMSRMPEKKQRSEYLLKKSYEHYLKAREVVENHNQQMNTENEQLQFAESESNVNDNIFKTALILYYKTNETEWFEKSFMAADHCKGAVISSEFLNHSYQHLGGVPDSLINKENDLKEKIALLQSSIRELQSLAKTENLSLTNKQNILIETMLASEKLSKRIEKEYPIYYQLKYKSHDVDLSLLKCFMGQKKTVVEYAFTNDSLYTFVLTGDKLQFQSQSSKGIEDSIRTFQKQVSKINDRSFSLAGISKYVSNSFWLYKKLVQPIEPLISNNDIVIIPDGTINLIPFEALVTSAQIPKNADYGVLNYLVNKYTFSYSFSSELYALQQQLKSNVADGVLAFAPEYSELNKRLKGKKAYDLGLSLLAPLKGTKKEVKNVIDIFGGETLTGKEATERNFKEHASENKILHLAMHTIANNENPMSSELVFTQTADSVEDNLLHTYEIYKLQLNSPLIILSACNTGNGKLMKGEGLISLARGFIYAGCPSMVYTLWSIADNSSSSLMQEFYQNIVHNYTIDYSLQQAKINYIRNSDPRYSHPYYWAGYIQSGKNQPIIRNEKPHSKIKWGIGGLVTTFVLVFILALIFVYKKVR